MRSKESGTDGPWGKKLEWQDALNSSEIAKVVRYQNNSCFATRCGKQNIVAERLSDIAQLQAVSTGQISHGVS